MADLSFFIGAKKDKRRYTYSVSGLEHQGFPVFRADGKDLADDDFQCNDGEPFGNQHHVLGQLTTHVFLASTLGMSSSRRKVRGNPWVTTIAREGSHTTSLTGPVLRSMLAPALFLLTSY